MLPVALSGRLLISQARRVICVFKRFGEYEVQFRETLDSSPSSKQQTDKLTVICELNSRSETFVTRDCANLH